MSAWIIVPIAAGLVLQSAVFSTTIYLHRAVTHRAITLHPAIAWLFRFCIWMTTGIVPREWVAVHRKHHAFTDEEGDPHSPRLLGFWKVQLGNIFLYWREAKNPATVQKYAKDMVPDWWDWYLFDQGILGLILGTGALCSIIGLGPGLTAAGIHACMYIFLSSSINGLCHHAGYKNFENTATNIQLIAWLTGGEGLHNNHHQFPRSPKFSLQPSEFDPAWPIIRLLCTMRLARPYKTISQSLS